jgi:signal transduction histidine kinase
MATARPSWRDHLSGLDIAAYLTWLAVSLDIFRMRAELRPLGPISPVVAAAGLLLIYLVGFIVGTRPSQREPRLADQWPVALMFVSAFALLTLRAPGTAPALVVVLAVMVVMRLSTVAAIIVMAAANVVLAATFYLVWHSPEALHLLIIYAGFQLFAAMTTLASKRAAASATELREVNAHLLATRSLLTESARESERLRLSRELHDVSGHKLTALKLNLAVLARDPSLANRRELQAARTLADELLEDIRGVVTQLRRHEGIDLREAFERLAQHLPAPSLHVDVADDARVADAECAAALVRLAQEGLTNSARHAGSRNVWLKLTREGERLQLLIEDDGRISAPLRPGHGVLGMHERVAELGGQLEIGNATAGGLRLCASLPRERLA